MQWKWASKPNSHLLSTRIFESNCFLTMTLQGGQYFYRLSSACRLIEYNSSIADNIEVLYLKMKKIAEFLLKRS